MLLGAASFRKATVMVEISELLWNIYDFFSIYINLRCINTISIYENVN
jgi:hypothetical protein